MSLLCLARGFRQTDYLAILAEVRDRCPQLRDVLVLDTDWDAFLASADAVSESDAARRSSRRLQFDDPINIQYTSGTTGFPKGATLSHHNILNNAYFTTEIVRLHRARPRLRSGAVLPLFRHGRRQPRLHVARRVHRRPGRGVRPAVPSWRRSQAERCTSLYGVPTMFIAELGHPRFAEFDLTIAAHRDHGRRAVPGRGDEAGAERGCTWRRSPSSAA